MLYRQVRTPIGPDRWAITLERLPIVEFAPKAPPKGPKMRAVELHLDGEDFVGHIPGGDTVRFLRCRGSRIVLAAFLKSGGTRIDQRLRLEVRCNGCDKVSLVSYLWWSRKTTTKCAYCAIRTAHTAVG